MFIELSILAHINPNEYVIFLFYLAHYIPKIPKKQTFRTISNFSKDVLFTFFNFEGI